MTHVPLRLGSTRTTLRPSSAAAAPLLVSEGPSLTNASLARVCHVCTLREARYTCPRCNMSYCCVDCYRAHGQSCTEPFFESHVRSEMQLRESGRDNSDQEKTKQQQQKSVQELLERVREFQEEQQQQLTCTEDSGEALVDRLQELMLMEKAGELTLESLTPEEKKMFLGQVANGRLGKLVELWSPWWLLSEHQYRRETLTRRQELILEEIGSRDNEEEEAVTVRLEVLYPVGVFTTTEARKMPQRIDALLPDGRKPSPCLRWHLIELVFGYTLVLRAFNGDYEQDAAEAALMLLDLCQVLSADARYESLEHVCLVCLEKTSDGGRAANALAIHDTQRIVRSNVFLLDALSDMRVLLEKYKQELEQSDGFDKRARKEQKTAIRKLAVVQKKLQFYQTWAYLTSTDEFQELATEIKAYVRDKDLFN
ncbi:unnamed protein product [Hyaloperonospora brassicae]|uniref:HIT-type domain-containing protein n=1 Tax=Hyaloperonospora brassicae TaxID=162125 RepID=A0AAV0U7P4_HYABA|nr:unnamed protein product [Hyaloperonospora brassicae]